MPQKKYGDEGPRRPADLSEEQVQARLAGLPISATVAAKGLEGEHDRPRLVSEEDVKARMAGKEVDLESRRFLGATGVAEFELEPERPRDVTDKDVDARLAGKELRLEERAPINRHGASAEMA